MDAIGELDLLIASALEGLQKKPQRKSKRKNFLRGRNNGQGRIEEISVQ
jgi:hypothetical protein